MRALILLLLLAALVGMRLAQRRGRKGLGGPMMGVALLAVSLSLTFALRPKAPAYLHRLEPFHRAVGYTLGRAITEQNPAATGVVLLQDRRPHATVRRFATQQEEGLREGLDRDDCELVLVNLADIAGKSTRPAEEGLERKVVLSSYGKFKAVMEAHPEARTIVSFAGYPAYLRLFLGKNPDYHALVWDLGTNESVDWDAELASPRMAARVTYKLHPVMNAQVSRSTPLEDVFAMRYELVTAP